MSSWLLMIFAGAVASEVGIRPFGYLTSMVVTIDLWLTLAPQSARSAASAGRTDTRGWPNNAEQPACWANGTALLRPARFKVGALRWTWHVQYRADGVPGTDRYPQSSLKEVREDPAACRPNARSGCHTVWSC